MLPNTELLAPDSTVTASRRYAPYPPFGVRARHDSLATACTPLRSHDLPAGGPHAAPAT